MKGFTISLLLAVLCICTVVVSAADTNEALKPIEAEVDSSPVPVLCGGPCQACPSQCKCSSVPPFYCVNNDTVTAGNEMEVSPEIAILQ